MILSKYEKQVILQMEATFADDPFEVKSLTCRVRRSSIFASFVGLGIVALLLAPSEPNATLTMIGVAIAFAATLFVRYREKRRVAFKSKGQTLSSWITSWEPYIESFPWL